MMDKVEAKDLENCFICNQFMGPFKNELTVVTGYSERPIFEIMESFVEFKINETVLETAGVCQNCFIKFNEYDEHQTLANFAKFELMEMYRSDNSLEEPDIKPVIKEEADEFLYGFAENIVEIVGEIYEEADNKKLSVKKSSPFKIPKPSSVSTTMRSVKRERETLGGTSKADKDEGLSISWIDGTKHYQCEFCNKDFPSRSRLKTHRQIHTQERNYMCQNCGASFKTMNCLKNHSRLHNNIFYHCDMCTSRFKGKHELRCHMDAIHLGRKDHVCQICGKAFSRDKTLRQHLMYHLNERNIVCEVCGFKTVNKPKMTRHMKSHTGERNYECQICGKRFLYSYNVTAHIKHVHYHEKRPTTNEEKLVCTVCGKKFQKIWKVKEHMAEVHKIVEATDEGIDIIAN